MDFWDAIQWRLGIGDPTFVGWLTVVVYAVAALYCLRVVRDRERLFTQQVQRQVFFWRLLAVVLVLLCINKQLDLQSLLTDAARYYFRQHDLYDQRRLFQKLFIIGMLAMSVLSFITGVIIYRNVLRPNVLAIFGIVFLMAFVVIRASSFHHMDRLISATVAGFKMNWLLELGGLALIICNARALLKRKGAEPHLSPSQNPHNKKCPASGAQD